MRYSGAEILIKLLERQGIEIIAGIPGGANLPIYTALADSPIRHILTRHEQGAGFISQGMARSTGKPAVCFATSGPGATNLITAIADAKLDSVPVIAITGQVPGRLIGTDAFQEVDTYGMTVPITKHNFLVRSAKELLQVIPEAFKIAVSGRPGPVAIDVPKDVQSEEIEFAEWPEPGRKQSLPEADEEECAYIAALINKARRPLMYIGGGVTASGAHDLAYTLMLKNSLPAVSTLMGLGCIVPEEPLYPGMLGMHGSRAANYLVNEADLILACGVRFDDRATGKVKEFCPRACIVHIDIDPSEIGKIKRPHFLISGDIGKALAKIIPLVRPDERRDWRKRISRARKEHPLPGPETDDLLHPINLIRAVAAMADKEAIVTTDVGQHQMWAAQWYPVRFPRSFLTSGGLGTMGFGLPAAIGAALAYPERQVICFSGDGSILMNIQELAVLADHGLSVKTVIFNNGWLGLVRQQQELFYHKTYMGTKFATNPDFVALAEAFGIRGYDLGKSSDPVKTLDKALGEKGPAVINAPTEERHNVYPMVKPGAANKEMIG